MSELSLFFAVLLGNLISGILINIYKEKKLNRITNNMIKEMKDTEKTHLKQRLKDLELLDRATRQYKSPTRVKKKKLFKK